MRIQIRQMAAGHERFGPHAFDRSIGREVPFTYEGRRFTMGVLAAAEVAADGSYALLTFDVPDSALNLPPVTR